MGNGLRGYSKGLRLVRPASVIGIYTRGERCYEAYDSSERPRLIVDPPIKPKVSPTPVAPPKQPSREFTRAEQEVHAFSRLFACWHKSVVKWLKASSSPFASNAADRQKLFVGVAQRQLAIRVPSVITGLTREDLRDLLLLQRNLFNHGIEWSVALVCSDGTAVVLPRLDEKPTRRRVHDAKAGSDDQWQATLDFAIEFPTDLDPKTLLCRRPFRPTPLPIPSSIANSPKSSGKSPTKPEKQPTRKRSLRDELRDMARSLKVADDTFVRLLINVDHPVREGKIDVRMAVKPGTAEFVQAKQALQRIRQETRIRNLNVDIGLIALDGCRHV